VTSSSCNLAKILLGGVFNAEQLGRMGSDDQTQKSYRLAQVGSMSACLLERDLR
jgi:hypothetical protein